MKVCQWCGGEISELKRVDAIFCRRNCKIMDKTNKKRIKARLLKLQNNLEISKNN